MKPNVFTALSSLIVMVALVCVAPTKAYWIDYDTTETSAMSQIGIAPEIETDNFSSGNTGSIGQPNIAMGNNIQEATPSIRQEIVPKDFIIKAESLTGMSYMDPKSQQLFVGEPLKFVVKLIVKNRWGNYKTHLHNVLATIEKVDDEIYQLTMDTSQSDKSCAMEPAISFFKVNEPIEIIFTAKWTERSEPQRFKLAIETLGNKVRKKPRIIEAAGATAIAYTATRPTDNANRSKPKVMLESNLKNTGAGYDCGEYSCNFDNVILFTTKIHNAGKRATGPLKVELDLKSSISALNKKKEIVVPSIEVGEMSPQKFTREYYFSIENWQLTITRAKVRGTVRVFDADGNLLAESTGHKVTAYDGD